MCEKTNGIDESEVRMIKCCHKCKPPTRWVTDTDRCHSTCPRYAAENEKHQKELDMMHAESNYITAKMDAVTATKETYG